MDEYTTDSCNVYPCQRNNNLGDLEFDNWQEWTGVVRHRLGIVWYSQYIQTKPYHPVKNLMMEVVHNGISHCRRWDAWYGKRTITRLANEFIEEIKS